jgi:hypothetical protein
MYTAVVLDEDSRSKLIKHFTAYIPQEWAVKCHHMTVNMGTFDKGPAASYLGQTVGITVTHLGLGMLVAAARVECEIPSNNTTKHITLAVNEAGGGKAKMSNDLQQWVLIDPLVVYGTMMEVV